jgi:hypothetical protein
MRQQRGLFNTVIIDPATGHGHLLLVAGTAPAEVPAAR